MATKAITHPPKTNTQEIQLLTFLLELSMQTFKITTTSVFTSPKYLSSILENWPSTGTRDNGKLACIWWGKQKCKT